MNDAKRLSLFFQQITRRRRQKTCFVIGEFMMHNCSIIATTTTIWSAPKVA